MRQLRPEVEVMTFLLILTAADIRDENQTQNAIYRPERDEEAVKKRKQEKKKISAEAKARKQEKRRKMRQKLKGREGRDEKMKRRKQNHRASLAEEAEE